VSPRSSRTRARLAWAGGLLFLANAVVFAAFTWPKLSSVRRAESRALEVSRRRAALEKVWTQAVARKELPARNRGDQQSQRRHPLKYRADRPLGRPRGPGNAALQCGGLCRGLRGNGKPLGHVSVTITTSAGTESIRTAM